MFKILRMLPVLYSSYLSVVPWAGYVETDGYQNEECKLKYSYHYHSNSF